MNLCHIWCDLKPGVRDTEFVAHAEAYFEYLKRRDKLSAYRITR